jgi:hypothetical protein
MGYEKSETMGSDLSAPIATSESVCENVSVTILVSGSGPEKTTCFLDENHMGYDELGKRLSGLPLVVTCWHGHPYNLEARK